MVPEPARRVAIVDDDAGLRQALSWLLGRWGYDALAFADADAVLAQDTGAVGCVLMDLRLGDGDGITEIARLRAGEVDAPVVIMTAYGDIAAAVEAVRRGAWAFLEKPLDHGDLRTVLGRAVDIHAEWRRQYGPATGVVGRFRRLTVRERQAFWAMARAMTIKEMALALGISDRTAEVHRGRVLAKMEVASVAELVRASFHVGRAAGDGGVVLPGENP